MMVLMGGKDLLISWNTTRGCPYSNWTMTTALFLQLTQCNNLVLCCAQLICFQSAFVPQNPTSAQGLPWARANTLEAPLHEECSRERHLFNVTIQASGTHLSDGYAINQEGSDFLVLTMRAAMSLHVSTQY